MAFHVYFQEAEGKLWNRLYRDGLPLRLPALISRAEFLEEVGGRDGAYQLQPVDSQERPIGDPPSMIFVPGASTARPEASPDGVTRLELPQIVAAEPPMVPAEQLADGGDGGSEVLQGREA